MVRFRLGVVDAEGARGAGGYAEDGGALGTVLRVVDHGCSSGSGVGGDGSPYRAPLELGLEPGRVCRFPSPARVSGVRLRAARGRPEWLLKFGRGMGSISSVWWAGSVPARGSSAGNGPRTTGRGPGAGPDTGSSGKHGQVARSLRSVGLPVGDRGAARPGAPGPAVLAPVPARRAPRVAWVDVRRGVRSPPPDAVGGAGDHCCVAGGELGASAAVRAWSRRVLSGPASGQSVP